MLDNGRARTRRHANNTTADRTKYPERSSVTDRAVSAKALINRRRLLLLGTTALAAIVSACCPRATGPIDEVSARRPPTMRLPTPAPDGDADADLPLCIDVHCHIFNGQDVDIAGFVRGPVASDVSPALQDFLRSLADLAADVIYKVAPSGVAEVAILDGPQPAEEGLESVAPPFSAEAQQRDRALTSTLAEQLAERFRNTDIKEQYLRLQQEQSGLESAVPVPRGEAGDFTPAELDAILSAAPEGLESAGPAPAFDPKGGFRLIKRLSARRSDNAYWLADTYAQDRPRVTVFMPALVDFDYWLGCPTTRTSVADQVIVNEKIAIASGGRVLPLVPYNPWTDIVEDDASFERVRDAVLNRGFVGVKIYPPMGYLPYGNADLDPPDNWPGWWEVTDFGARLDAKLLALYAWCQTNDVPILAHSSHSQGALPATADLAGPDGWRAALIARPGLKVCLGHFGGDNQFSQDQKVTWSEQFLALMREPFATGLHADISYFQSLLSGAGRGRDQLRDALASDLGSRFMYGSDWHLLVLETGAPSYASRVAALIGEMGDPVRVAALRRSVFFETAVGFYSLRAGGATRQRLDAFYARNDVSTPAWLAALDATTPAEMAETPS